MSREAALIIGVVVAIANAIVTLAGLGNFDDGLQWEDLILILGPTLGALGIRTQVWAQSTVDLLASRASQSKVLSEVWARRR